MFIPDKNFFGPDLDVSESNIHIYKKLLTLKNHKLYKLIIDGLFDGIFSIHDLSDNMSDIERRYSKSFKTPNAIETNDRLALLCLNRLFGNLFAPGIILARNHSQLIYLIQQDLKGKGVAVPDEDISVVSQHRQYYTSKYSKKMIEYREKRLRRNYLHRSDEKNMVEIKRLNKKLSVLQGQMEMILILTNSPGGLYDDWN